MHISPISLCIVVALGGCAAAQPHSDSPSEHRTVWHSGDAMVSVIGTPFYLLFKGFACGASTVMAAPAAGLAAVSASRFAPGIQDDLGDGLARNCGPPYALSPYRAIATEPRFNVLPPAAPPPEPPSKSPKAPAPRPSTEPAAGPPDLQLPEPPTDYPAAPTTRKSPQPAAEGPIELFNR